MQTRVLRRRQVIPKERRTQLFSATMTTKVAKLQRACLRDPVKVEVAQKYSTVDTLRQQYLFIPAKHKVRCHHAFFRVHMRILRVHVQVSGV